MGDADVSDVTVNCTPGAYTVAGEISDLNGTVVLSDGNGHMVTASSDGSFSFPPSTASTYNVTVTTQPSYPPAAQTCVVSNGSGSLTTNVINVAVVCSLNTYTIGGTVAKLTGTLVLADNGGDDLSITTNAAYKFATAIASRSTYAVTVATQPSKQWCTVNSPSGTVTNANITNANVECDSGIPCASSVCTPGTDTCCDPTGTPSCVGRIQQCSTGGKHPQQLLDLPCATAADCSLAGTTGTCCATTNQGTVDSVRCTTSCTGVALCDPAVLAACPTGKTCQLYAPLNSKFQLYYACQ
jgi:hypothetical protein